MRPESLENHNIEEYLHETLFDSQSFKYTSSYFHDGSGLMVFPIGMHKHRFYEINIIIRGKGFHYLENKCIEAVVGNVFIIPPDVKHGYYSETNDLSIFHLLISCAFVERYKNELSSIPGYSILFEIEPFLRMESSHEFFLTLNNEQFNSFLPQFNELVNLENSTELSDNIIKIGKTLCLISSFSRMILEYHSESHTNYKSLASLDSSTILRTMEYIQSNLSEKISIDKLAKISNMSRSTYIRQFKNICKCNPADYIMEMRIKKAAELLVTDFSIATIAQNCGFFDSSHFTRFFNKYKNCTPSEYRNKFNYSRQ